ncbi:MAG: Holliday junction branch migration protein RuvA [Clostridia bacterium]|nr:Holliday junction branch migration protein RuvA [Clostridia bacterium]
MIGYVKGKVIYSNQSTVILETAGGTGYEIYCSNSAYVNLVNNGEGGVFTYLSISRDNEIALYGFSCIEEKNMFLKLISVSGVGPKMGITVLSSMNLKDLALAIANENVKTLSTVKGLGKKTAERIILELREKVTESDSADTETGKKASSKEEKKDKFVPNENSVIALMSMGLKRSECNELLKAAEDNGIYGVEEQVVFALKNL